MVDISKAKNSICPQERYFHKWLDANGFDAVLVKQLKDVTIYDITKDGVTDRVSWPMSGRVVKKDVVAYIAYSFEMMKKLDAWEKAHEN